MIEALGRLPILPFIARSRTWGDIMKTMILRICVLAVAVLFAAWLMTVTAKLADDPLGDIAAGNMAEIALSQIAVDRSQDPSVKQFAQMMVDDHTKAADQIKTLATTKNVTLPAAVDSKHQSAITKLGTLSGADFDREYIRLMVKDHEKMVSLLQKQADRGADADIKTLAAGLLPTVQSHLAQAKTISGTLAGSARSNSNSTTRANSGPSSNRSNSNRKSNRNTSSSNANSNRP
jgi:putative membrane protein